MIAVENNTFKSYLGNYDDYRNEKEQLMQQILEKAESQSNEKNKKPTNQKKTFKNEVAEAKTLAKIEILEAKIKELDLAMLAKQLEYDELNNLYCRKLELNNELDSIMDLWLNNNLNDLGEM